MLKLEQPIWRTGPAPSASGIYAILRGETILYIGESSRLGARITQQRRRFKQCRVVWTLVSPSIRKREERKLIEHYRPRFSVTRQGWRERWEQSMQRLRARRAAQRALRGE